jgi:hypothetical protein
LTERETLSTLSTVRVPFLTTTKQNGRFALDKISAVARALGILLAVVAAFVSIPQASAAMLVLGAVAGVTAAADTRLRLFAMTIVLMVGAKSLTAIPAAGDYLATIFGNIGMVTMGASATGVVLNIIDRVRGDWVSAPAAVPSPAST